MVKEHVVNDHLTLVRNPYYYQGLDKPYLDQVTYANVGDEADAELSALQTHAVDATDGLDYSNLASYRAIPGYTTRLTSTFNVELLVFNFKDPILSDHAVRQAITMGINRNTIIQAAINGAGSPTCDEDNGTFAHEATLTTCYPFDPPGANHLLDADGWTLGTDGYRHKNGQTLELQYATTPGIYPLARHETQALIHDELKAIGMQIDLKVFSSGDFFGPGGALTTGSFQIGEFSNQNYNYVPVDDTFFTSTLTVDQGGSNFMGYANPEVDQLLARQAATADVKARMKDFQIIHADVLKDLPVMYLYSGLDISCARSDLHNYDPSGLASSESWNIGDWWLSAKAG
jgi:peptide/nickel transport system substrate-binding protein